MESLSQLMSTDPCEHRKELVERLDILRRNENFCDVTITVKGKEFKAHRAVLAAASPFFLSLLTSDMRESNERLIRIDLEEATESVIEDVLKYIYTGNVLVTEERAHDLIATANYLLLPGLKTVVGNFLKAFVSVENCFFNFNFANKYQCVELKEKCWDMMNSNFSVLMETVAMYIDFIFVCGGRKALCYFPQQNLWHRLADTNFEHKGLHTLGQYKNTFCIFDGQENKGGTSLTEEHFSDDNDWTASMMVGFKKPFSGYTVLKDNLYGIHSSYSDTVKIYRCDAESSFCDQMEASPFIQVAPCVVSHEQFLYIIGGVNENDLPIATTTRFDTSSNKWEEVAALNEMRYSAFGVAMNDNIFIAGGRVSFCDFVSSCEVYIPTINEWQLIPSLKVPRSNASMVCFQGMLYVLGGYTGRYMRALTVEVFDSERIKWVEISAIPVRSFETKEEEEKMCKFKACFARLNYVVMDKLNTVPPL